MKTREYRMYLFPLDSNSVSAYSRFCVTCTHLKKRNDKFSNRSAQEEMRSQEGNTAVKDSLRSSIQRSSVINYLCTRVRFARRDNRPQPKDNIVEVSSDCGGLLSDDDRADINPLPRHHYYHRHDPVTLLSPPSALRPHALRPVPPLPRHSGPK